MAILVVHGVHGYTQRSLARLGRSMASFVVVDEMGLDREGIPSRFARFDFIAQSEQ